MIANNKSKLKHISNKGFTIIEALIVLAIAGLILLIVFLAVPNLQRNNRNTQKRADINVLGAGVIDFIQQNAGSLPGFWDSTSKELELTSATPGTFVKANTNYYSGTKISITAFSSIPAAVAPATNALTTEDVRIVTAAKCDSSGNGAVITGSAKSVAIQFTVETASNANLPQCRDF